MALLKKGRGPTKKKQIVFKYKIKISVPNIIFFWWSPQILFYKHRNNFIKVYTKQVVSISFLCL